MLFNNNLALISNGKLRSASKLGDNLIVSYKSSDALNTDYYNIKTKAKKQREFVSSLDYFWVTQNGYLEKKGESLEFGGQAYEP